MYTARVPCLQENYNFFFLPSRSRHTRLVSDWSSDVCSSDLSTLRRRTAAGWQAGAVGLEHRYPSRRHRLAIRQRYADAGCCNLLPEVRDVPRRERRESREIGRASWRGKGRVAEEAGECREKE